MELTCPIQCIYRLTEVTVRKDLAQQSTQKTLKGLWGHFQLNGDMVHQYCISTAAFTFLLGGTGFKSLILKRTSRSKIRIWQCVKSDQLYLLSRSSTRMVLPRAAAQLAALLISLWLKTLHVPWKTAAQSSDIDRATLRWVFLFLPVCGSWAKDGGGGSALSWPTQDNT